MEPLTVFSLCCNIITSVEAAIHTVRELKELYESSSGLAADKERLHHGAAQLRAIATELDTSRRRLPSDPQQQPLFIQVAEECAEVTNKIDAVLAECQVGGRGPRRVAVIKAWVRSRKKKPELDRLQAELQSTTQRLQTSIAVATRYVIRSH
jgi:hypothetical protein